MTDPDPSAVTGRNLASRARPFIQFLWAVGWVLASFWLFTPMAYHYWAAGGPPTPYPEWHAAWGNIFFSAILACWAIGGLGAWFMRRRPAAPGNSNPGRATLSFSVLMVFLIMALAVWSVPGAGRVLLLAPVILGAAWALARLRRSESRK
jgi:hypothetical protein